MKKLILILGGARSGKSDFALRLAKRRGGPVLFVATATPGDAEMADRIAAHRRARPADWVTVEAPTKVAAAIGDHTDGAQSVLVDCLTLLASNVLMATAAVTGEESRELEARAREELRAELDALLDRHRAGQADFIIVSNEVGEGIVPAYPLARLYRDLLGWANAYLAARADAVYLLVAGLPVDVKLLARETERLIDESAE